MPENLPPEAREAQGFHGLVVPLFEVPGCCCRCCYQSSCSLDQSRRRKKTESPILGGLKAAAASQQLPDWVMQQELGSEMSSVPLQAAAGNQDWPESLQDHE